MTSRRYGNCLTASRQGACTAQPVRATRRLIEGNSRGEAVTSRRYGKEIVSRHKHNMLSLVYATCLKLLVFFFFHQMPYSLSGGDREDSMPLFNCFQYSENYPVNLFTHSLCIWFMYMWY